MHEIIKNMGVCENNAGFSSAFGRGFILSGDCTGEEGCDIPLVPGEPSAEWRKTYFFSLYCHALYSSKASGHLLYQQTSIPWVPIHSGQPDRHTPTRLIPVYSGWEHLALPAPCSAAFVWLSEEAQSSRGGKGASLWLPRGADPRGSRLGPLGWALSPPRWRGPATPSCSRDRRRLSPKCRSLLPRPSKTLEPSGIKALPDLP